MSDLSPATPINEIFEAVTPEEGMRVIPTEIPASEGKRHLAILITGSEAEANVMMANLMSYVNDMSEVAQQQTVEKEDEPTIIVP